MSSPLHFDITASVIAAIAYLEISTLSNSEIEQYQIYQQN